MFQGGHFLFTYSDIFFCRMYHYHLATVHSVTDRRTDTQTDRQTDRRHNRDKCRSFCVHCTLYDRLKLLMMPATPTRDADVSSKEEPTLITGHNGHGHFISPIVCTAAGTDSKVLYERLINYGPFELAPCS